MSFKIVDELDEICGNCSKTFGSHHAGTSPWPYNYCPDPDCRMDWKNGPGTVFKATGKYLDKLLGELEKGE